MLKNSEFARVIVGTDNAIVSAQQVGTLKLEDCKFTNVKYSSPDDKNNLMINIRTFALDNAMDSSIKGITVESSSIGFLQFNSISGTLKSPILIGITSLVFRNCKFDSIISLISFGNVESQEPITFALSSISFTNLTFVVSGKLLEFHHQLKNVITVTNANFTDIKGGEIYVEASNKKNLASPTKVELVNFNVLNIDANYNSLIRANEGADLTIRNSTFQNVFTLEEGSVVFAGYQNAVVTIRQSTFLNNYAVLGGVLNIESGSVVKIYE